ncbi:hypothetical protein AB0H57_15730 [Micromonospora sp. NPDC050686]|uniref:hypothetical protein n=1 Tax=Micromonospora sp. NPDC050686 TaxID=3154631 RepID=UPI0033CF7122
MIERETSIAEVRAVAADQRTVAAHEHRHGVCVICHVPMCRPRTLALRRIGAYLRLDRTDAEDRAPRRDR